MSNLLTISSNINLMPIEIWEPKYSTHSCLIATRRVKSKQHYKIWFSYGGKRTGPLTNKQFYISADRIKSFPKVTNGSIPCYQVPMSELQEYKQERTW